MFTEHGCADCNLIREVRENERGKVVDEAVAAIDRVMADADDSGAAIFLMIAASRVEALADSPPAGPAEGTGSAGRGQEAS